MEQDSTLGSSQPNGGSVECDTNKKSNASGGIDLRSIINPLSSLTEKHYISQLVLGRCRYRCSDPGKSVYLKDLQDASTSGTNQRNTPQEEIQNVPELPDLEESFDETSSEFNIGG
ncbi:hypothetical protein Avbf_06037 [Armadillidium vulgare]|nr:hypothetical protein Avbf_06037 [Armadillidium vulgare]